MADQEEKLAVLEEIDVPDGEGADCTPLVLIHDGSGMTFQYYMLQIQDRPVYAITNPYFSDGSTPEGGVTQLALEYIKAIDADLGDVEIIVGGTSAHVSMRPDLTCV